MRALLVKESGIPHFPTGSEHLPDIFLAHGNEGEDDPF
jgi:hypothetical protein